ncbi:MAG: metal-dependent transcriptional regulator [Anaerolineales bacterium]|jgi:DtxR family Mn-dependent transcriptional regulator|nr:metal-dependent transcriptional regulator [Anaerolineales bacterium]
MTIETTSVQDYLKTIFDLTQSAATASTTALAARLGVAPASVTGMVQKLAAVNPPLVNYRKHQGVTLTEEGQRAALEVIRHHRLLETYLVQMLGYSWDNVHEEACRLEHVISEDFETRIAEALGHPQRDPHGDPIPSAQLTLPTDHSLPLSTLRPAQQAVVVRVQSDDPPLLRHLDGLGLIPGAQVTVLAESPFDQNLEVLIDGQGPKVIGLNISSQIHVEVKD